MQLNLKTKKIITASLVALFTISTVAYKIATLNDSNSSTTAGENSKGVNQTTSEKTAEYSSIFKKDSVIDIKVELPVNELKDILENPMEEEYKNANVTINGTTVKDVGFRTKGNLTLKSVATSDSDRFSFRIKLDKYVDGQNLLGLDELVVNNMYADPSFMREYLSYEALREIGADVPETVFANVYINGESYGFYLCVEAIDDSFLERNFGNNDGNLYKQEKGSNLQYNENGNYESYELKEGEDETKADLKNLTKVLSEMTKGEKGDIETVLEVDSALRYIAANTVLGNYDSYSGNMVQNYYLYSQNGKFTVIPWDYNMSFGGFGVGGDATTIPIDEPVMGVNVENLPLINNLLAVKEYKDKYHQYVSELVSYLDNFETRVTGLSNIIRPYVEADTRKFYTMEQFEANLKYTKNSTEKTSDAVQNNGDVKQDVTSSATQNTDGKGLSGTDKQRPQGGERGAQSGNRQDPTKSQDNSNMPKPPEKTEMSNMNPPANMQNGDMPAPPAGMENGNIQTPPKGDIRGDMKGGPNGGMMGSTSIVTYVKDRIENIKKQLSGELPTTGNTTMNGSQMGGGRK